ncbi:MAG: 2-oxo-4-hydroxy-4-carboxy-5-ureidoimidazoline decarboxylase [Pseudomonadales bacterium]|jgi:OHCU decarboxylase|nr:2-oxo-4-hydroxy-4-carboxy-5-ureidoimidazoline decarboxylase [Pseudomonadales bacterium]
MTLEAFNGLEVDEAVARLRTCCESERWARAVADARPYGSPDALLADARVRWREADEAELLAAFAAHPRIGDVARLRARFSRGGDDPANREQGQVLTADDAVLQRLKTLNDVYFERFGFIFIVRAAGRSAAEMLALLEAGLVEDRASEIARAAREQEEIMVLRLTRLLQESGS